MPLLCMKTLLGLLLLMIRLLLLCSLILTLGSGRLMELGPGCLEISEVATIGEYLATLQFL